MIVLPTALWAHSLGDLGAWTAAGLSGWCLHRSYPQQTRRLARIANTPSYYRILALSAIAGAWLAGTLNSLPINLAPSHSLVGALAGAIIGVELWKWRHGIRGSTGSFFVLPLAVSIMVGRIGCLFSGLPDLTYGVPCSLTWAVDLGDGIGRHPVQAYESLAMAGFLAAYIPSLRRQAPWATVHAFHAFVIYYGAQRFLLEFLKPYPKLVGPFNLFHLICAAMVIYGILWWRRDGAAQSSGQKG